VLHRAAVSGTSDVMEYLLKLPGIEVNKQNVYNETALYLAVESRSSAVIPLLLAHPGIDPNLASTEYLRTPLMAAAIDYRNLRNLDKLLEFPGINLNAQDANKMTALHIATLSGNAYAVYSLLCEPDIDCSLVNNKGHDALTALLVSESKHWPYVVEVYLMQ